MSCTPIITPDQRTYPPDTFPFKPIPVGKTFTVDQVREIPEAKTDVEILVAAHGFAGTARYTFDSSSTLADDGAAVLKPSWRTVDQPGRWLREDLGGMGEHLATPDPHSQYETTAEVAAQIANHEAAVDPHTQYERESQKGVAGGYAPLDGSGDVPDTHIAPTIARLTDVDDAIADHEAAPDPHPQYTDDAEAEAIAQAEVADHEAAADPHPGYQQESEKETTGGYAGLDADGLLLEQRMPFPRGRYGWTVDDDFHMGTIVIAAPGHSSREGWVRVVSGAGATVAKLPGTPDRPGILELHGGTATNSRAHMHLDLKAILLGGGRLKYECGIYMPLVPDAVSDFKVFLGLAGVVGAGDPANAVGLMIDRTISAVDWLRFTSKGGVKNKNTTTLPFVGAVRQKVEFIVNPAANNVDFFVDGAAGGSETTNIPIAAGEEIGFILTIEKVASTNDRTIEVDFVTGRQWLTNPR